MEKHHILSVGISLSTNFAKERNCPAPIYYLHESFQVAVELQ